MIKKSSRKILLWVLLVILVLGLLVAVILFFRKKERLCPLGYSGKDCEPFCNCKLGWSGPRCGTPKTDYSCNHVTGKCDEGTGGTLTLAACSADCKPCPDCGKNGKCNATTGICDCTPPWTGDDCNNPYCPNGCFADNIPPQGTCDLATGACVCNDGWALSANGDCSAQISTYGCNPASGCDVNFLGGTMTLAACNAAAGCKQCTSAGCLNQGQWCDASPQA